MIKRAGMAVVLALVLGAVPACGGGGGADKVDVAALKAGASTTAKLKFFVRERGIRGEGLADNAHFDDGANQRVVLYYAPALKDKVAALEVGKTYKVTFTFEKSDPMVEGTLTAVE